jgi:Cu-processing system ATP-binding protein
MIKLENTSKRFGKLQVLDSVSLTLERGECIALIGPNGCGKTTLIKSVLGMVVIDNGKLFFQGKDISNDYEYRRNIGYMPQIGRYPENMTVGQVIEMIKNIRTSDKSFDEDLLEQFDLRKLFTKRMCTLSGGTTQKVSATLAFLFNPDVLILDEPTAGLDPLASEILKSKITLEKQKGKLIVITSHVLSELDDLVTQLVYMQDGKVVFHKSLETLRAESGEQKISRAIANLLKQKAL